MEKGGGTKGVKGGSEIKENGKEKGEKRRCDEGGRSREQQRQAKRERGHSSRPNKTQSS